MLRETIIRRRDSSLDDGRPTLWRIIALSGILVVLVASTFWFRARPCPACHGEGEVQATDAQSECRQCTGDGDQSVYEYLKDAIVRRD